MKEIGGGDQNRLKAEILGPRSHQLPSVFYKTVEI
jgi:hypothetical protein